MIVAIWLVITKAFNVLLVVVLALVLLLLLCINISLLIKYFLLLLFKFLLLKEFLPHIHGNAEVNKNSNVC